MDFGQLGEMGSCLASPFEECILLKRAICENECVQRLLRARTDAASIARRTCQSVNGPASGHSLSWKEDDNGSSEDLFHGHGSGEHTRLSLDDLLDEIVDVVGVLVVGREEPGVLEEAFCLVGLGADGEDGGEQERELFDAHGLNFEGVVDRRNIQQGAGLPWERKLCYSQFPRAHQPAPSCVAGSSGRSSGGSEGCSDGQVRPVWALYAGGVEDDEKGGLSPRLNLRGSKYICSVFQWNHSACRIEREGDGFAEERESKEWGREGDRVSATSCNIKHHVENLMAMKTN